MKTPFEANHPIRHELKIKPDLDGFSGTIVTRERFHWLTLVSALCALCAGFALVGLVVAVLFYIGLGCVPLFAVLPLTALLKVIPENWSPDMSTDRLRSFGVSPHSVRLGKKVVRWSDVTHIKWNTYDPSNVVRSVVWVVYEGNQTLSFHASPEAVQWLRRLFKYYHREAQGAGGGVPQSLEELRQLT